MQHRLIVSLWHWIIRVQLGKESIYIEGCLVVLDSIPNLPTKPHTVIAMADPSHFSDPFWSPPPARPSALPQKGELMFVANTSWQSLDQTVGVELKVGGLGTISAKSELPEKSLMFTINSENPKTQPTLTLEVTKDDCILKKREKDSDGYKRIPELLDLDPEVRDRSKYTDQVMFPKGKPSALLDASSLDKTTYWISVDRSNARIRYGKYLTNNSMTFMEILFDPKKAEWMKHLNSTDVYRDDNVRSGTSLDLHLRS